jgi:hypothetical protein
MVFKKALLSYSIFRYVSVVVTTTITREWPQTVLSWKQRCYKAQFVLLRIRSRIRFAVSINIEFSNRWLCGGVENFRPP